MDIVKKHGELAFGTRLRRLSETLTKDVSHLYKKLNIDFEAKWFVIISALFDKSPMTITELAANLGISHTAVNQLAKELLKKGYITSLKGEDERQRLLSISTAGISLSKKLTPVWDKIKEANVELINNIDPNFLSSISKIEEELARFSMYERVWVKMNGSLPGEITIIEYNARMKKHFKRLNYEWLQEYFTIEDSDKKILLNPKEQIINNDGTILFALLDNEVAGTCALIKHPDGKYELAKMAVTKKYQGRGIGRCLLEEAIKHTRNKGAAELYLLTSEKLISANILYRKLGFIMMKGNPFNDTSYNRRTYAMKLNLIPANGKERT